MNSCYSYIEVEPYKVSLNNRDFLYMFIGSWDWSITVSVMSFKRGSGNETTAEVWERVGCILINTHQDKN